MVLLRGSILVAVRADCCTATRAAAPPFAECTFVRAEQAPARLENDYCCRLAMRAARRATRAGPCSCSEPALCLSAPASPARSSSPPRGHPGCPSSSTCPSSGDSTATVASTAERSSAGRHASDSPLTHLGEHFEPRMLSQMRHPARADPDAVWDPRANHRIWESNLRGECSRLCVREATPTSPKRSRATRRAADQSDQARLRRLATRTGTVPDVGELESTVGPEARLGWRWWSRRSFPAPGRSQAARDYSRGCLPPAI